MEKNLIYQKTKHTIGEDEQTGNTSKNRQSGDGSLIVTK